MEEIAISAVFRIMNLPCHFFAHGCPPVFREYAVCLHGCVFHEIVQTIRFHQFHETAAGKEDSLVFCPVYNHGAGHLVSYVRKVEPQLGAGVFQRHAGIEFLPPCFAVQFGAVERIVRLDAEAAVVCVVIGIAGKSQGREEADGFPFVNNFMGPAGEGVNGLCGLGSEPISAEDNKFIAPRFW